MHYVDAFIPPTGSLYFSPLSCLLRLVREKAKSFICYLMNEGRNRSRVFDSSFVFLVRGRGLAMGTQHWSEAFLTQDRRNKQKLNEPPFVPLF